MHRLPELYKYNRILYNVYNKWARTCIYTNKKYKPMYIVL